MNIKPANSDEQLVRLAQDGDKKSYNLLLERYYYKILQMIQFNINDQANVNDLAQEVLLKVHRYLPYFKQKSKFSTWLYRITQNTIKNYYRTVSQRVDSELHFASEQNDSMIESPEHIIMNMEFNEKVVSAISKLSHDLRACYDMHTFDGQTYEEIAKRMHCPIGTVRSRIFRARKLLINSMSRV